MNNHENWRFENDEQRILFEEAVTKQNCGEKLKLVQAAAGISRRELAKVLGVSEATLRRIELHDSEPTDEFMQRLHALCAIGRARFTKLSESEKERASEVLGVSGGVVAGIGGSLAAVSAAGAVSGISAAGITSGLAAVGGGAMLTGIGVVAAIPVAAGAAGYAFVKGIKKICDANRLKSEEVDGRWEIRRAAE